VRHEMLAEAVEIIRELWTGEWVTYRGTHLTAEDARIWSLPEARPGLAIAASGPSSIRLAVRHADHIVCDGPDPDVASGFKQQRPEGEAWCQIPVAFDRDHDVAVDAAHHFAFGATGWKVMAELPNVPGFDAAAELVRDDDITELVATGADPATLVGMIRGAVDAGYDRVSVVQVGPDRGEGFMRWWQQEVRPELP
jgi:G6PDH family F420-dependent oxidoreductase